MLYALNLYKSYLFFVTSGIKSYVEVLENFVEEYP